MGTLLRRVGVLQWFFSLWSYGRTQRATVTNPGTNRTLHHPAQQVYEQLRRAIEQGSLLAGTPPPSREHAASLGVSRNTVLSVGRAAPAGRGMWARGRPGTTCRRRPVAAPRRKPGAAPGPVTPKQLIADMAGALAPTAGWRPGRLFASGRP